MAWTYILKSQHNGRYYVGSTDDKENRLIRHNAGYVRSTKSYRPWLMVYFEYFGSKNEAFIREMEIKSWKKRSRIEKLINDKAPSSSG